MGNTCDQGSSSWEAAAAGEAPILSVIIAARNAATYLPATLASVFKQTLPDFEIIVVDDGSTDGTADLVHRCLDPRVRLIRLQENEGVSAARNMGIGVARAPLIVFLDADDLLMHDALEKMVRTLSEHPDAVGCFGRHIKITEDGASAIGNPLAPDAPLSIATLWDLLAHNFILLGTLCVRTSVARRAGGFRSELKLGEDWEFWCRIAVFGNFMPLRDILMKYRQRTDGASQATRGTVLRPNMAAVDAIFANQTIVSRFTETQLRDRRRKAELNLFWTAARGRLLHGDLRTFIRYLLWGAICYPETVLQVRRVWRFFASLPMHGSTRFTPRRLHPNGF